MGMQVIEYVCTESYIRLGASLPVYYSQSNFTIVDRDTYPMIVVAVVMAT